jgi:hypothetical protein
MSLPAARKLTFYMNSSHNATSKRFKTKTDDALRFAILVEICSNTTSRKNEFPESQTIH